MAAIEGFGKIYYCPLKTNRLVDDSGGAHALTNSSGVQPKPRQANCWRGFPKDKKVKLFRVIVSTDKTEYVVTNDLTQDSMDDTQQVCAVRSSD
jgi:hypothetical protein